MKMINVKTKSEKHVNDNEKRCKSIKEREKVKLNRSLIIKEALSNNILNSSKSKKIVFDDDDDNNHNDSGVEVKHKNLNGKGKIVLFDGSDSDGEGFEFKEKTQFSGKKGFELLNLQSTYGNDERFKIDERFLDNVENDDDKEEENYKNRMNDEGFSTGDEKVTQLKILENVLGESITTPKTEKKTKKRTFEMVHYDASNKDHEKYEIKHQSDTNEKSKRKKERKKMEVLLKDDSHKPQVSKEKFYEVSSDIKNNFKEKNLEEGEGFSLLQTYGGTNTEDDQNNEDDKNYMTEVMEEIMDANEDKGCMNTSIKRSAKEVNKMIMEKPKIESREAVAKGIWKESFFFAPDDPRFKEALEFMNKKDSNEAVQAVDNYDKTRRQLKEILRLHMKKQLHKKDPFKNKVGGMNKKQLANLKLKNSKVNFSKRKIPKMNHGGKI